MDTMVASQDKDFFFFKFASYLFFVAWFVWVRCHAHLVKWILVIDVGVKISVDCCLCL